MDASQVEDEEKLKMKNEISKFLVIGIMIVGMFGAGCAKKEAPKPKEIKEEESSAKPMSDSVQQKVLSFNLEGLTDKGAKKWEVMGDSAEAISENEVGLNNIVAKAYGEDAQATIIADKGVYDKSKNNVKLRENVKATIENAEGMGKEYMDFSDQLIGTPKSKKIENPVEKKKTKTEITCDGEVQFDYEKDLAYFDKNVKVISDDGATIDADRITVNLEPKTKKIKDIVAEGNVRIVRGENTTYSEKATYIEAEKRVVLTGKPKLVIYQEGGIEGSLFKKE